MVAEKQSGALPLPAMVPRRWNMARPVTLVLVGLAGLLWWMFPDRIYGSLATTQETVADGFQWSQVTPSKSLEYHDCFDGFQCARLEVPMDYHRADGQGRQMAIAIVRLPAKVPVTDPRYGGAILLNPGGPGLSGVAEALLLGRETQTIVDAEADPTISSTDGLSSERYFDIIGFDPRGVNNTTPGFSCFPDSFSRKNWELQVEAEGMLGSSDHSLMPRWQRALALNSACSKSLLSVPEGTDEALGEHINTPPVARDMLEIIERHGEWRGKHGQLEQGVRDKIHGYDPQRAIAKRTEWKKGAEKLLYWGRSYGTVLGATFAAMFPDRIERAVLDGVVDLEKYYTGEEPDSIVDADAIFDRFGLYCDMVGLEGCPFYTEGGPAAIKGAYVELENALYKAPVPVAPSANRGPEIVTWTDLKAIQRMSMYQPLRVFPMLAQFAKALAEGDGSAIANFKLFQRSPSCLSDQCATAGPWSPECQNPGENEPYATLAIFCSDSGYLRALDQDAFKMLWTSLKDQSTVLGDFWASVELGCVGFKPEAKWQFTGSYAGNTSHPILFVSNTLDPVTPLRSAQKMSRNFLGSVVLEQDSEGHTTLAAPSVCVSKTIRTYFQTGALPDAGMLCSADWKPLLGNSSIIETLDHGERVLYDASIRRTGLSV